MALKTQSRREYLAFQNAKYRCTNPGNAGYANYGGRGIEFRFSSFDEFFVELGPKPSPQHSLDRYPNNDGHYEKGNVRWATRIQQVNNCRPTRIHPKRPPSSQTPLFLTVEDVAIRLQIPKSSVYELTRFRPDPTLPRLPARKIGRSLRFVPAEIDSWVVALPPHTHLRTRRYIKAAPPIKVQRKGDANAR